MPHLTLQFTANLDGFDAEAALREVNQCLADSGHFDEVAIKSRAMMLQHYRVGTADSGRGYVHVQLKILPGRDDATRRALAQSIVAVLQSRMPTQHPSTQLCVEVDEIDAASYSKLVLDASPHTNA